MKARRWKTWAKHLGICAAIVCVASNIVVPWLALIAGAGFYLVREIMQQRVKWWSNTLAERLGAVGDVLSAWIGGGAMWWILTLIRGTHVS